MGLNGLNFGTGALGAAEVHILESGLLLTQIFALMSHLMETQIIIGCSLSKLLSSVDFLLLFLFC